MRINTGRQIITTINFADGVCETEWTPEEHQYADIIDSYADAHRENAQDPEYLAEYGLAEVFEYELAGLRVVALMIDGKAFTVWTVEDADIARYHTAVRTGRTMAIRYVKTDGSVSRREIRVGSVRRTKDGHTVVRALDVRKDEERSFRADRITHSTLHRATAPARPTKAALAAAFRATVPAGPSHPGWNLLDPNSPAVPAPRPALEESAEWFLYDTTPGSATALEAPESVQDKLAEAFASGRRYVKVYA
jgi:predicted DNA-binding transcriptional regulator YafY